MMRNIDDLNPISQEKPRNGKRYRVISYLRSARPVEEIENAENGNAFTKRRAAISAELDDLYGVGNYDLIEFEDNGASGALGFRATVAEPRFRLGLGEVVTELQTKSYDAFIVHDFSQLSRSVRVLHEFLLKVMLPTDTRFICVAQKSNVISPTLT